MLVVLLAVCRPAQAKIYTWHDENGTCVLSDRPHADGVATFVAVGAPTIRTTRAVDPTPDIRRYDTTIQEQAARFQVRPDLVRAIIHVESVFDPNARQENGAMGLMQLMPETVAALGVRNAYDPVQNIQGGVAYLRQLLDRYNADPGAVAKHGNQVPPYPETQAYFEKVDAATDVRTTTDAPDVIYETYEEIGGRRVPLYTNVPPPPK